MINSRGVPVEVRPSGRAARLVLFVWLVAVITSSCAQSSEKQLVDLKRLVVPLFEVPHQGISEMSGLTRSHNYPGVYWVHNDSGDDPRVFSISGEGELIWPPFAATAIGRPSHDDRSTNGGQISSPSAEIENTRGTSPLSL